MSRPHQIIYLCNEDRLQLEAMISRGISSVRKLKRAEILLKSDDGYSPREIATMVDRHYQTVYNIRRRYIEEGLESALEERPRPGKPNKIFAKEEAIITTIACSKVPAGCERWTLQMIADRAVELTDLESVSKETISQVLKKVNLNHGKQVNGASVK